MARQKLARHDEEKALELVRQAIARDPACAAAHMLLAEIDLKRGEIDAAIDSLRQLQQAAPHYLMLVIPLLLNHDKAYAEAGKAFLLTCWQAERDELLALAWIQGVYDKQGEQAAQKLMQELEFEPHSLDACLHLKALLGGDDALARAAREWQKKRKNFACARCGVRFVEMRWQCPQCHEWGVIRPMRRKEAA